MVQVILDSLCLLFGVILLVLTMHGLDQEKDRRLVLEERVTKLEGSLEQKLMGIQDRCDAIIQWHDAAHPNEKPHSALKSERY